MMKKGILVLIGLIVLLVIVNYSFLDSLLVSIFDKKEIVVIERVIDGDTVVIGGASARLLGINAPERGEDYYEKAKSFLESFVLNKTVFLERRGRDKYSRSLIYIFVKGKNINLELVREGFANSYFPSGEDIYYEDFKKAWEDCERHLCEKSEDACVECIELEEFDYEREIVAFYNRCDFDCDLTGWEVKDEGRKSFVFSDFILGKEKNIKLIVSKEGVDNQNEIFWRREDYVWTDSGDTLFLRDDEGKLVLWSTY